MSSYYKLLWAEDPVINDIPGFVWPDEQTAIAHYDDFVEWTYGETEQPHLYEIKGPKAIQSPVAFDGRLSYMPKRRRPQSLSDQEVREALDYFNTKDPEFFGLAEAGEQDELLFLDLAATVGVLKAHMPDHETDPEGYALDEYFIGIKSEMRKIK
jgi:hypothetical protein